jgi:polyisoprenoid-binding protein YceI
MSSALLNLPAHAAHAAPPARWDPRAMLEQTSPTLVRPAGRTHRWTIAPSETTVGFGVSKLRLFTVRGSFGDVAGTIDWEPGPSAPRATAEIEAASVATGIAKRDADLRTPAFLDTEAHPRITFRSTGWQPGAGTRGRLIGELTIRDRTHEIALDADLEIESDGALRFSARCEVDRFDFGVSSAPRGILVGRTVAITLDGVARPA